MKKIDEVKKHFDKIAKEYVYYKKKNSYYYDNLKKLLSTLIPKNSRVCEIGCGTGDLLNYLKPKYGYGMDLSTEMVKIAKKRYPKYKFSTSWPREKFDHIFMSDVIEHMDDHDKEFSKIANLMSPRSIFINTMANPIWEPILIIGEKIGYKMPEGPHNRIKYKELKILLKKSGMKIIRHDYKLLMPIKIPVFSEFANKYLEKYFKKHAFIEYFVAKKS